MFQFGARRGVGAQTRLLFARLLVLVLLLLLLFEGVASQTCWPLMIACRSQDAGCRMLLAARQVNLTLARSLNGGGGGGGKRKRRPIGRFQARTREESLRKRAIVKEEILLPLID